MSYPINQNMNPYKQPVMGINTSQAQNADADAVSMGINAPQLQNINTDTVIQNSALKGIQDEDEDSLLSKKTFALSIPVTAGMIYGMDKFNAACAGTKYEDSLVGRANAWGEKIGQKVPFIDTCFEKADQVLKYLDKTFVSKSNILSAFCHTPSEPESPTVFMMRTGTHSEIAGEAISQLENYVKQGGEIIGTATKEEIAKLANHENKRTLKDIERIMTICREQGNAFIKTEKFWNIKKIPLIGRVLKKDTYISDFIPSKMRSSELINRSVHFSEFANKIESIINPRGATSAGKNISKYILKVLEGLTNGTAGGKIAMFMGAYFVADAIKKTINAPSGNGEKRKTFAENMISNVGMYMTMPLSIILMHKFGGLQYIGMGKGDKLKDNLTNFREALAKFNERVDKGLLSDKKLYKSERKALKAMLKSDTILDFKTDGLLKTIRKIAQKVIYAPITNPLNIMAVGLERIKPYISKETGVLSKIGNTLRSAHYKFKGGAGYPMRMGIFIFAIAPFFNKILAKGSHLVFGKPAKSILDYGKEPKKEEQLPALVYPTAVQSQPQPQSRLQPVMQAGQTNAGLTHNQMDPNSQANSLHMYNPNNSTQSQNQRAMIPTEEPVKRRYIPSEEGVKLTKTDYHDEKANEALNKAEKAEKYASKHLK